MEQNKMKDSVGADIVDNPKVGSISVRKYDILESVRGHYYFSDLTKEKVKLIVKRMKPARIFLWASIASLGLGIVSLFIVAICMASFDLSDFLVPELLVLIPFVFVIFMGVFACFAEAFCSFANKKIAKDFEGAEIWKLPLISPKHLEQAARLYNACVDAIGGLQYIDMHELQASIPDYSMMDYWEFRGKVGDIVAYGWFHHGKIVNDTLCITETAVEYFHKKQEEKQRAQEEDEVNVKDKYIHEQEQKLFAQNKRPDDREIVRKIVCQN